MSDRVQQYIDREEDWDLDMVERWAIRLALGNSGGKWETHYTEQQKQFWRDLASSFLDEIEEELELL